MPDYVSQDGVDPDRGTETWAEVVLRIDTPRWHATRVVLRAGKALAQRRKGVLVRFRPVEGATEDADEQDARSPRRHEAATRSSTRQDSSASSGRAANGLHPRGARPARRRTVTHTGPAPTVLRRFESLARRPQASPICRLVRAGLAEALLDERSQVERVDAHRDVVTGAARPFRGRPVDHQLEAVAVGIA